VHRNIYAEPNGSEEIELDRRRQWRWRWRLGEDLTYAHSLWNDVPIYLDTTDCTIRHQQMYSKMYSKEATRDNFEDYTPLKKLLV
jgi:hypothetical protein